MKSFQVFKLFLACIVLTPASAQNVGVNATSPEFTLDVRGEITDTGAVLNLGSPDNAHFLRLFSGRTSDPKPFIWWRQGEPLRFAVGDGAGTFIERMQIRSGGTIGINTSNPMYPLHVNEPAGVSLTSGMPVILGEYNGTNLQDVIGVRGHSRPADYYGVGGSFEGGWRGIEGLVNASGALSYTGVYGEVSGGSGTNYGVYGAASGSGTNYAGYFGGGHVYIQNRLGIGQSSPLWPLDISGSQAVTRLVTTTSTNGSVIELRNNAGNPTFLGAVNFNNSAGTNPGQIAYEVDHDMTFRVAGATRLEISSDEVVAYPKGRFFSGIEGWNLENGNATNIALFAAAAGATTNWAGYFSLGNVYVANQLRIGTESGATGYQVSVKGKVICEELKIQLQTNWPDYVFARDYELIPLRNLEQQIKTLGHLPGMPDAEEVVREGIEVGEMQRRLLEKIEELTLYVIDLQQQNDALHSRLEEINNIVRTNSIQQQ